MQIFSPVCLVLATLSVAVRTYAVPIPADNNPVNPPNNPSIPPARPAPGQNPSRPGHRDIIVNGHSYTLGEPMNIGSRRGTFAVVGGHWIAKRFRTHDPDGVVAKIEQEQFLDEAYKFTWEYRSQEDAKPPSFSSGSRYNSMIGGVGVEFSWVIARHVKNGHLLRDTKSFKDQMGKPTCLKHLKQIVRPAVVRELTRTRELQLLPDYRNTLWDPKGENVLGFVNRYCLVDGTQTKEVRFIKKASQWVPGYNVESNPMSQAEIAKVLAKQSWPDSLCTV